MFTSCCVHDVQDELLQWSRPEVYGTPPKPRSGHNACTVEDIMIVSGGRDHHGLLSDAHVFNFISTTWSSLRDALLSQVCVRMRVHMRSCDYATYTKTRALDCERHFHRMQQ